MSCDRKLDVFGAIRPPERRETHDLFDAGGSLGEHVCETASAEPVGRLSSTSHRTYPRFYDEAAGRRGRGEAREDAERRSVRYRIRSRVANG